ncbi:MAG TPA: HD-GYP domain-containing protein [Gaiellaceae bacterium]
MSTHSAAASTGASVRPGEAAVGRLSWRDTTFETLVESARVRDLARLERDERLPRWLSAAGFVAAALLLAALGPTGREPAAATVVLLVLSYAAASRITFEVGSGFAMPTQLIAVPMLLLLPAKVVPLCVGAGLVLGALPDYVRGRAHVERVSVVIGGGWYSLAPALLLVLAGEPGTRPQNWGWLLAALGAQFALDFSASALGEWTAVRVPPSQLVAPLLWVFMVDALLAPIGLAVGIAAGVTTAALVLPLPLLALIAIFARERQRRIDHALELSTAYQGTAFLLGDVVEADDAYTGDHSRQVVELVVAVAERLGLGSRERRLAELAALLHDVGKIRIPSAIINKPGPLTPEERRVIETHTIEGERLLAPIGGLLAEVGAIVRSCHEHYDGNGYPDRLAGNEIPLVARVVSCCDAYNAMTTDRPYRRALSVAAALDEARRHAGTQFDPTVVDALEAVVTSAAA